MLFVAIYTPKNESEESQKRSLQLFTSWTPPFEFKAHYARSDAKGGVATSEADDAAVVLEGIAPFTPFSISTSSRSPKSRPQYPSS